MSSQQFETIGKYVLLEKLAMGGMAEVFLGRALGAGGISKFFAIKRILPQYADSPEFIEMFREEAKIAINLKHSNIVSIHEFGIQEQQFFLVMDYVEGRNLRQILNKMKKAKIQFTTEHIIFLIREIAAGLDHAHRCIDSTTGKPLNITHRDMSPQNVMVSFDGEVKIVDFGIAKAESQVETTRAGTLKGKFGYMSPEQAEGLSVDMRTDIFSLGIVMWEILANDRLFAANNEINTLRKIRDCHIPSLRKINPNIHSDLEKIVQKSLSRDKNLRYQTAAALHKDLNRFLNRQYPDFSSHDFASNIKSIFADEILQSRKKLVSYAKSSAVDVAINVTSHHDDKTTITASQNEEQTSSYVATETDSQDPQMGKSFEPPSMHSISTTEGPSDKTQATQMASISGFMPTPAPTPPPGLSETQNNSSILDSRVFNKSDEEASVSAFAVVDDKSKAHIHAKTSAKPKHQFDPNYDPSSILTNSEFRPDNNVTHRKNSGAAANTRHPTKTNIPVRVKSKRSPLTQGILYSTIALVTYFTAVKFLPQQMSVAINSTQPLFGPIYEALGVSGSKNVASTDAGSIENKDPHFDSSASPDQVAAARSRSAAPHARPAPEADIQKNIIITSEPSGAEIYINGEKTGQITPSRLMLSGTFQLELRRRGFTPIRQTHTVSHTDSKLEFSLKKPKQGYLFVEVQPLQEVSIYVDGKKIEGENFPLRDFPIPADHTVVVKVVGTNGAHREQKVTLRDNEKKVLNFNLGQPARQPSNRR